MTHNIEPRVLSRSLQMECEEMLFYLHMPIKLSKSSLVAIPKRLRCFTPMIDLARSDFGGIAPEHDYFIYLTAKSLYVTPEYIGGREGWHIDGFGTEDKTYIWSDRLETEFCIQDFELGKDCDYSLVEMAQQANEGNVKTFGEGALLALDTSHVHRCPKAKKVMRRTFVKLTFSKDRFDLKGNSHNHLLDYSWTMFERHEDRNHTSYVVKPAQ